MNVNKINIDSDQIIDITSLEYFFNVTTNCELVFNIGANITSKIVIFSENSSYKVQYNVQENSDIVVNSLNNNSNCLVTLNLDENSKIVYNYSVVSLLDSQNTFTINHYGINSISEINNNGINLEENKLFFEINGIIKEKMTNIKCVQNSKIINFQDGNSKIIPNLIIDSNDIVATHSAYIGNFDPKLKFYMESRGLSDRAIKGLLYKSILLGKMDLTYEEAFFNEKINEWW